MTSISTIDGAIVASKYAHFTIIDSVYKAVNGTPVAASIMIPKGIQAGNHPVLVRWHGGGLVTVRKFAAWILDLAHSKQAIIVCPDYRLLPEAKGTDQLQDHDDLYAWLFLPAGLTTVLSAFDPKVAPNLHHILVVGESAGGWFALQSGFLPAAQSARIGAIIAQYPMIDMRARHYAADYDKDLLRPPVPQLPRSLIDTHVANLSGNEVVTSRAPSDPLLMVMVQRGLYPRFFGAEKALYPLEALDDTTTFPPLWIFHGAEDSLVPASGTEKFAEKMRRALPHVKMHVTLVEGEEHGFDNHDAKSQTPATLDTPWLKAGLDFIDPFWP